MPKSAEQWFREGHELRSQGSATKEAAIECFDKAIAADPRFAAAWTSKGQVLHYLHRYDDALNCLRQALQLDPGDADTLNSLATAADAAGKRKEAIEAYERFLECDLAEFAEFEIDGARERLEQLRAEPPNA